MIKKIKGLLFTDTGKDAAIVFTGTFVNVALGGLFFILAPRILGPEKYGLFAVIITTGTMAASLANLGIDSGILRFSTSSNFQFGKRILKLALEAYLAVGIIVLLFGLIFSPFIADLLGNKELTNYLRIAFSGSILILLTDFFIAVLQSRKQFLKASIVSISSNFSRLTLLLIAIFFFTINLYFLTILFFFIPIISIICGKLLIGHDFLSVQNHHGEFKKFFSFNLWIAASMAISSVPFDNYLLTKFAGSVSTGLYFAPDKILSVVDQFAGNFSRVLASRFSSFTNIKDVKKFSIKTTPIVLIFCFGLVVSAILAKPLVSLFLGNEYLESVLVYRILSVSYAFFFADVIAVSVIVYYFGKPNVTFMMTIFVMILWVCANIIFIPDLKEIGAAIAHLISGIAAFILFNGYLVYQFMKNRDGRY